MTVTVAGYSALSDLSISNSSELNDHGDQAAVGQQRESEETILEFSTSRYGRKRTGLFQENDLP